MKALSWRGERFFLAALLAYVASAQAQAATQPADILITGGTIYDGGTGKPFRGDVAISGDRIVFVGRKASMSARRTIDAKGLIVAPGFIDGHSHSEHFLDSAAPDQRQAPAYLTQGVSTVLVGIDGRGLPELADQFDRYRRQGIGVNVASYVGFGTIRSRVIGDDDRAPNPAELATEKGLVAKGMCEGAVGLSTGLFYFPQSYAKTDEVVELAKAAAQRGGIYDTHQRDESDYSIGVVASTKEVLQIGTEANIPVHISHIKVLGSDVWGKSGEIIDMINQARARGQNVTANQYPWLASKTPLDAALVPRWAMDGGYPAMIKRFDDPGQLPKIQKEMTDNLRRRNGPHSILLVSPGHPWTGKYLDEIAKEWGIGPVDAAIRILRNPEKEPIVSFNMSQDDVDNFAKQPWVAMGSDGSPGHPREAATWPYKYVDEVKTRHVVSLTDFIHGSTGLPADIYMLDHRGYLKPGYYADVVVFNPDTYAPRADYIHPDLLSTGIVELVVNGKFAVDEQKMTQVLSGRPLAHIPTPGTCT